MDSPTMKTPSTERPTVLRASEPWRRVLQAAFAIVAVSASAASAQTGRNAQEANDQWRRLTQAEINCVDQALRGRNSSLWGLIQRGVGPSDPAAAELRAGCRAGATHSATITTSSHQASPTQAAKRDSSREPSQTSKSWSLNGSTLKLVADGDQRRFYSEASGTTPGALLLEGKIVGTHFVGTAYKQSSNCGRVPYRVDGMFRDNNLRLELQGQSPRIDAYCFTKGTELSSLTLKAVDSSVTKKNPEPGEAGASKTAVRSAGASQVEAKLARQSMAADQPATGKGTSEQTAADKPAVDKSAAGKPIARNTTADEPVGEKIIVQRPVTANADVVQVASVDKPVVQAANEGATEVMIPLNRSTEPTVTPSPAMGAARAEGERAKAEDAKPERAQAEPSKADSEVAPRETTTIAAVLSADLDSETRLSFICGLLSGVATAGALALMFFARQRKRNAKAPGIAAEDQGARRGGETQIDLLVRAVLAEQKRQLQAAHEQDRAERV